MPIPVQCTCGKQASVRDELAGKAIKCPNCSKVIQVPGAAKAVASRPAAAPVRTDMDDLFAEEGLDRQIASICPACSHEMKATDVLCTKCGFNKQTGERLDGHKVAGVDIDVGTMALQKAAEDIKHAKKLQEQLQGKQGMPPWMLGLILFLLGGATVIAVIVVNASRRIDENVTFSPMGMFLNLAGAAFALIAVGATLVLIGRAFMSSRKEGFLSLTIVYLFYFAFQDRRERLKVLITAIVCGGLAGGAFAMASTM